MDTREDLFGGAFDYTERSKVEFIASESLKLSEALSIEHTQNLDLN